MSRSGLQQRCAAKLWSKSSALVAPFVFAGKLADVAQLCFESCDPCAPCLDGGVVQIQMPVVNHRLVARAEGNLQRGRIQLLSLQCGRSRAKLAEREMDRRVWRYRGCSVDRMRGHMWEQRTGNT